MKRLWHWLEKNSSQLQGLAAMAAIIAALAAVPFVASRWLQPDLMVKVSAASSTVPPDLEEWIMKAARNLQALPTPMDGEPDPYSSLRELQSAGPLDPVRSEAFQWHLSGPGSLRIDLINQTDRVIPGVRLRLERAHAYWGTTLSATFLTADEVARWQEAVARETGGPSIVLPELPPLPPESAATIVVYGGVENAEASVTVPGTSFKVVRTVHVEDRGMIGLMLRPYWLPFVLSLVLGLLALIFLFFLSRFERETILRVRRIVTYDLACSEAKAGRTESALALLQRAIDVGYNDITHMRNDPDLESLRKSETFLKIIGTRSA